MLYFESPSHDAYFNMAMEEHFFTQKTHELLFLWRNKRAVVVGNYQNTAEEVGADYCRASGVTVVRRLSGGGAMYQDLGNVNYTFIVNEGAGELDFERFTGGVIRAIRALGAPAQSSGRNDLVIDGRKISGGAQFSRGGRTLHHGTLLFDSALSDVGAALTASAGKLESKGVKSVRARVDNIRPHLGRDMDTGAFIETLARSLAVEYSLEPYRLPTEDIAAIEKLAREKYSTWEWNYGQSPPYTARRERRFDAGTVEAFTVVESGIIREVSLRGDFFASGDIAALTDALRGVPARRDAVVEALDMPNGGVRVHGISAGELAELIAE